MIIRLLKGSGVYFALTVIFTAAVTLLDLAGPRIVGHSVDSLLSGRPELLPLSAAAVLLIAIAAAAFRYLAQICNARGTEGLVKRTRDLLYSHIVRLPFSWYQEVHTGDIIQRCTSDVETIKSFISEQLSELLRIIMLIVLSLVFMAGIHTRLTLCAALMIPVVVLYSMYFHGRMRSAFLKADVEEGKLSAIAQENLTGIRVVRAFGRENYERERFEKKNNSYTEMWVELMRLGAVFWAANDLIGWLQILIIVALGAYFCVGGELSAGDYLAFISYNIMLSRPVRNLGRVISEKSKADVSLDRIRFILDSATEDEGGALRPSLNGDILLKDIHFSYAGDTKEVLNGLNMKLTAGGTTGILGATGSGKSTLMYLLDKLYLLSEDQGEISIGGVDIRDIDTAYLRNNTGFVLQEPYLFSGTLAENIAISVDEADKELIAEAAEASMLSEAAERLDHGYDTFVGERGVTLSGGQKQRAAIARMLIKKPQICIFDDSLSAVDAQTDLKIRRSVAKLTKGSTVILISHRVMTLMNADRIYVMDKGRIVEEGTHEELMKRDGVYRVIYELQA